MTTATVTTKGQITIPVEVRNTMNIEAGDRVEFVAMEGGRYEIFAASRPVQELKGMFGKSGKRVSVEQMNRVIAKRGASAK